MTFTNYQSDSSESSNPQKYHPGLGDDTEAATQPHASHDPPSVPEPSGSGASTSEMLKQINVYSKQGRWKDMARLQIKMLDIYRSNFGETHPSTLSAMYNLAASYAKLKRLSDAEGLYRHVLLLRTRTLGEGHTDTLRTMQNLATACAGLGKHFEAAEYFEKVLRIRQRTLGERHPETLFTMHNLAMAHTDLGNFETAEHLYQTVLLLRGQILGKDHSNTLGTMRGLALVYEALGRLEEAKSLCERLLSLSDANHGRHNIHSLRSLSALATIHRRSKNRREADDLEIELLERRRRFRGNAHPDTLTSMKAVAVIYRDQRRWNEARALEAEIEQISQPLNVQVPASTSASLHSRPYTPLIHEINAAALARILGKEHPEAIDSLEDEAISHMHESEWNEAISTLREVLRLRQKVQGSDHFYTIRTMNNLVLAYHGNRDFDKAAELLQGALNLVKQSQLLGADSELHSKIQSRMSRAESYLTQSQHDKSAETEANALPIDLLADNQFDRHVITSEATITEIMACLTTRGCPDLTRELDYAKVSRRPTGGGGYSDVWKGALSNGSAVALKCLRGNEKLLKASQISLASSFANGDEQHAARELYSWAKAYHENVLELWGMAILHEKIAMVSPWMESGSIIDYLARHPNVDRLRMCVQVARGLAYLHDLPLIHGDIKASNVFVTGDGVVKVGDFGLAILLCEQSIQFSDTGDHTQGTVRWMAPELFETDSQVACNRSLESDVYSLGMTILEIITGRVPFWEITSVLGVMRAVVDNKRKPSLPDEITSLGEQGSQIWSLLNQCWDVDPKNRPTATGVLQQLEEVLDYYPS